MKQLILLMLCVCLASKLLSEEPVNRGHNDFDSSFSTLFIESGIVNCKHGNFHKALTDFNYIIHNATAISDDLLAAYLMRAYTYKRLGRFKKSAKDIAILKNDSLTLPQDNSKANLKKIKGTEVIQKGIQLTSKNEIEDDRIKNCQRKCDVAETAGLALCGSLVLKGVKGILTAAACAATIKILSQQCEDCCIEGFDNCGKEIESFVKDVLDSTYPTDSSILD